MPSNVQFRRVLPVVQTATAALFGGCGLWLRSAALSASFFDSTLWNSTASFHVWPWPYRFAAVLNLPALLLGQLVSGPIGRARPQGPEWIFHLPSLLTVPLLWFFLGYWLDRKLFQESDMLHRSARGWVIFLFFTVTCFLISLVPYNPYRDLPLNFTELGALLWILTGVAIAVFSIHRKLATHRNAVLRS
jgi:hypothetical protein